MAKYERVAFLKFFLGYFISVALLILVLGFLYYKQMYKQLLQKEHFSLIEYARHLKSGDSLDGFVGFSSLRVPKESISMDNLLETKDEFIKTIPMEENGTYLRVIKHKSEFLKNVDELKFRVKISQLLLLLIFGAISYFLAKNAIKPMQDSIDALDRFSKDLIHDLNTPIASMKLNIKLLENSATLKELEALSRLKKSLDVIVELEENLTILLDKKSFVFEDVNVCLVLRELVGLMAHQNLDILIDCKSFIKKTNQKALKEILNNLLSNAIRYSGGFVKIYIKDDIIYIYNNSKEELSSIQSRGRGLNIVKQLSDALNIKITYSFSKDSNIVSLAFDYSTT